MRSRRLEKVSGLFTALVVDADLDGPMPWLATAYVAGPSLTEAVRGHGPLPSRSLMALAAGLAEGLGAIHAAGVVHRDLKPSNVLLAEDGPRVIDFGISEAAEASAAAGANVMIGSPGYMSPEQVLGAEIGPASDMFSLGAVLTFAATGQGPFGAGSNAALMYRLVNSPAKLGDVPGELRPLVGRCLAKHPGDRPTAREMLAEVGALQPAPGWLAESIMSSFVLDRRAAAALGPAEASKLIALTDSSGQPPRSGEPPRGGTSRPGRHRVSRTLASAVLTGGLVAGSAVAAFALIGANRAPEGNHLQPQTGAGAAATLPASASNPSASPGASSSSSASPSASIPLSPRSSSSRSDASDRPAFRARWRNRSYGSKRGSSPFARMMRARGIQSVSSPSMRCPTTSKALNVSGPSVPRTHGSARPPRSAFRVPGVRASTSIDNSRSKSMTPPPPRR